MNKKLSILFAALLVSVSSVFAAEAVYKTISFPSDNKSNSKVGGYTSTWTSTTNGFAVSISNFNNNNWNWTYIKCGSKSAASVATITTTAAIDQAITKVVVTIDKVTASSINSATLTVASDASFKNDVQTITVTPAAGELPYVVTTPTANMYYKLTYDCQKSSNGILQISKIDYYYKVPDVVATAISIDETASLAQYKRDTLKANLEPANTTTAVVWSSSDESIVTVADGVVFAKAVGTAKIYAKAGNLSDSCAVTVAAATPITVDEAVKIAKTVTTNNELAAGGMYVIHGYAVSVDTTNYYKFKNYTVGMADAADETAVFSAYQVVPADGKTIVAVGDQVEVIGDITKYNTTYETVGKGAAIIQVLSQGPTTYIDNTSVETSATKKVLRNGQIFIIRDDKTYTTTGMEVK